MTLKQAVDPFHAAQGLCRKTLGAGTVGWVQTVKRPGPDHLRHQLSLAHDLVQQVDGAAPRGNPMSDESDNTDLPPAALRALAEAEERRKAAKALELPTELGGRDGPEPVRYGDWEKKGIAVDF